MRPDIERRARSPVLVATAIGATWGFAGYALLWGYTPIVVHPPFVLSPAGTVLLLPARIVLWSIHGIERVMGRSFELSENNWWIGIAAGVLGAAIAGLLTWGIRAGLRRTRASGRERVAERRERL